MSENPTSYLCPNCGAIGIAGNYCDFCGTLITAPKGYKKKSSGGAKRWKKTKDYYESEGYNEFWNRLLYDDYIPVDIFENLKFTALEDFWIPFEIAEDMPDEPEKAMEMLRRFAHDKSYLKNLPSDYPSEYKTKTIIIDFEYKGDPYYYVYVNFFNSHDILNKYDDCKDRLSVFPFDTSKMVEYMLKEAEKASQVADENTSYVKFSLGLLLAPFIVTALGALLWMLPNENISCFGALTGILGLLSLFAVPPAFEEFNNERKHHNQLKGRYSLYIDLANTYRKMTYNNNHPCKGLEMPNKRPLFEKYRKENRNPFDELPESINYSF